MIIRNKILIGILILIAVIVTVVFLVSGETLKGFLKIERVINVDIEKIVNEEIVKIEDQSTLEQSIVDFVLLDPELLEEFPPSYTFLPQEVFQPCPDFSNMEYVYVTGDNPGGLPYQHSYYFQFYDAIKEELEANNGEVKCPYYINFGENNNPDPYEPDTINDSSYRIICYKDEISLSDFYGEDAIKCSKDLGDITVEFYLRNDGHGDESYLIFLHGGDFWEKHEMDYFRVVRYL